MAGDEFEPDNPLALTATGFLGAACTARRSREPGRKGALRRAGRHRAHDGHRHARPDHRLRRCHDHKYDPIPTRDYYRLLSTFTTTVRIGHGRRFQPGGDARRRGRRSTRNRPSSSRPATKYETEQLPAKLDQWLASRERKRRRQSPALGRAGRGPANRRAGRRSRSWPTAPCSPAARTPTSTPTPSWPRPTLEGITAVRLEALADPSLVKGGPGRAANGNFDLTDFRVTAAPLNGQGTPVPVKLINPEGDVRAEGPAGRGGHRQRQEIGLGDRSAVRQGPRRRLRAGSRRRLRGRHGADLHAGVQQQQRPQHRPASAVGDHGRAAGRPDGDAVPADAQAALAALDADPTPSRRTRSGQRLLAWYRTIDPEWRELNSRPRSTPEGAAGRRRSRR